MIDVICCLTSIRVSLELKCYFYLRYSIKKDFMMISSLIAKHRAGGYREISSSLKGNTVDLKPGLINGLHASLSEYRVISPGSRKGNMVDLKPVLINELHASLVCIRTYNGCLKLLLSALLENKSNKLAGFDKIKNTAWFGDSIPSREIAYCVVATYVKYKIIEQDYEFLDSSGGIQAVKFKEWLSRNLSIHNLDKILDVLFAYTNEIKIIEQKIFFNPIGQQHIPPLKIAKLHYDNVYFRLMPVNKANKLTSAEDDVISDNMGHCRARTYYGFMSLLRAFAQNDVHIRRDLRAKYVQNMQAIKVHSDNGIIEKLRCDVQVEINKFTRNRALQDKFLQPIKTFYGVFSALGDIAKHKYSIGHAVKSAILLMQQNITKIEVMCIVMANHEHTVGLILRRVGYGFKLYTLDSWKNQLYSKCFMHVYDSDLGSVNNNSLGLTDSFCQRLSVEITKNMPYLIYISNDKWEDNTVGKPNHTDLFSFKCCVPEGVEISKLSLVGADNFLQSIQLLHEVNQNKLLLHSLHHNDRQLALYSLQHGALTTVDENTVKDTNIWRMGAMHTNIKMLRLLGSFIKPTTVSHENGLSQAIYNSDFEMVRFLVSNSSKLEYDSVDYAKKISEYCGLDNKKLTALIIASYIKYKFSVKGVN